jgi:hypothetical protein
MLIFCIQFQKSGTLGDPSEFPAIVACHQVERINQAFSTLRCIQVWTVNLDCFYLGGVLGKY